MIRPTMIATLIYRGVYPSFEKWAAHEGKAYSSLEEISHRAWIYHENLEKIHKHNQGNHTWTMGVNQFADLTADEFSAQTKSKLILSSSTKSLRGTTFYSNETALPLSVDWTTKGVVTPVKNQGQCGSCWAFSTTGSVEGAWALAGNPLVSLSEQQLVDCSSAEGNQGCSGGLMDQAFQYIIDNKGITSEKDYPYTGEDGSCQNKPPVAHITSFTDVPANSETALMTAIAKQPVSVAVEADQASFQFYSGGVMTAACGTQLDHGVLAVGYGTLNGQDYYKVKNSWGADWGMDGYILLGRGTQFNPSGQCGIQMVASYPVV